MGRSEGDWIWWETSDTMEGFMNITTARGGEKPQRGACPFQGIWKEHTWVGHMATGNAGHTIHRVGASTVSSSTGLSSSPISRKATP